MMFLPRAVEYYRKAGREDFFTRTLYLKLNVVGHPTVFTRI
jgi:hypothetical protein